MVDYKMLNELYNCLDLYIVSSRYEGGPQAIVECGVTKTPIISTNVGVAPEILSSESIFDMDNFLTAKPNIEVAYENSMKLSMEKIFPKYIEMFRLLNES
jgi:glycosyltransferase involved in cell wall biosynthesis